MSRHKRVVWLLACILSPSVICTAQSGAYSRIQVHRLPANNTYPIGIAAGPDGALWFALNFSASIGRVTTAGVFTIYPTPTPNSAPLGITAGPDGALWFTEGADKIGRISTTGVIAEYPIPTSNSAPRGITAGPDGALWFVEGLVNRIGRITTQGAITEYPIPSPSEYPHYITSGPDGALWFTWVGADIAGAGRMTTAGAVTLYPAPGGYSPFNDAQITAGPDGALWFADALANIWRITTSGQLTRYPVPLRPSGGGTGPITAGPDGALWFTVTCSPCAYGWVGRITTAGVIAEFPAPSGGDFGGIAAGPDGALWFTEACYFFCTEQAIFRAPACALGLSANFTGTALETNFSLGIDTPANWSVLLPAIGFQKPIPSVVPPRAFTLSWNASQFSGNVPVTSTLSDSSGKVICSEWTTVNTGR